MSHIDESYSFGRIEAPTQWHSVSSELISQQEPTQHPYDDIQEKQHLHTKIRDIRNCIYTPDATRDIWQSNPNGDCEDKCLHLIGLYTEHDLFNSLRLAICELSSGTQHAVLLMYTTEGTKVIDPTRSTLAVDWENYPISKWIMRHRIGFLWENFKEL